MSNNNFEQICTGIKQEVGKIAKGERSNTADIAFAIVVMAVSLMLVAMIKHPLFLLAAAGLYLFKKRSS